MDNKRLIIILSVWTVIFTIMGGTLAYWNWQSADNRKTNVTFTVNRDYTCGADSGGHITSNDVRLAPAKCNDLVYAIKRPITTSVTTTGDKVVSLDLWLNINNISTNLTNTPNFKWVIGKNGNSCESGIVKQGDFRNIQDNKIDLLDDVEYATLDDTYYLYIWLDEAETNANTMNQSFDFSISGKCTDNGLEKTLLKSLDTTDYFREVDYKEKITDISFIYDKDLPSGITTNNVKTYDLGSNTSKPITGYLVSGDNEDTYKLYVSSEYKIYAQSLSNAFQGMTALKNISFDNFDTSLTTTMSDMFKNCSSLTTLDLSAFNTLNVTTFNAYNNVDNGMFSNCSSLTTLDLGNFNTSKVTGMVSMFSGCNNLISLDVSSFDTSNVTNMMQLFHECNKVSKIDVTNFNTSNVTNMSRMFYRCNNLTILDVSHFDTSNVTNMSQLFEGCNSLPSLDLSNFNTSKVTNMQSMFYGCSSLTELDLSNFDTSKVEYMNGAWYGDSGGSGMFKNCTNLKTLNLNGWDISKIVKLDAMFMNCSNLDNLDLSSFDTSNVTTAWYMFSGYGGNIIYVSDKWNTDNVTSSTNMFRYANKLPNFNSSVIDKTNAHYGEGGYLTYKAYNG